MRRTRYENIVLPNRIEGEEPTRLQGEICTFDNGEKIGVFWNHRENEEPELHEIRSDFVNALHELYDLTSGKFRYMEYERDFDRPYREFTYEEGPSGNLARKGWEHPLSHEGFNQIVEACLAREQVAANQQSWREGGLPESPERAQTEQQHQEAPGTEQQAQKESEVPLPRLDDYEPGF